jgi:bacterioferritin-associated ferredoxin
MYICICNGITEHDIRRACTEEDVHSLRELERCLGVGAGCGLCRSAAQELLSEQRRSRPVRLAAADMPA